MPGGIGYVCLVIQNDYIMRIIEQLQQALAKITGLQSAGEHARALEELRKTYDLLGIDHHLLDVMSEARLAELLDHPEKIRAAAKLALAEADIRKAQDDDRAVKRCTLRALELYIEAHRRDQSDQDAAVMDELRARLFSHNAP